MPRDAVFYRIGGPLVALALAVALVPWRDTTPASNLTFAFMALVILVAEMGGRTAGIATAVASGLCLDFFLTRPYLRLAIEDKDDVVALLGLTLCGLLASASRARGPAPVRFEGPAGIASSQRAYAEMSLGRTRRLAFGHLVGSLVASLPLWLQAATPRLPEAIVWVFLLVQGYCAAMTAGLGVAEARWRRLAGPGVDEPGFVSREIRNALWVGLAVISLVPWCYAALGRPAGGDVVSHTAAFAVVVGVLLAIAWLAPRTADASAAEE